MKKLVVAVWLALMSLGLFGCKEMAMETRRNNPPKDLSRVILMADQLISSMTLMAKVEDQNQKNEYDKIIHGLLPLVEQKVKQQPDFFQVFLKEMMEVAVKKDSLTAMQVEEFASEKIKGELQKLRQEIEAVQLSDKEKDKRIACLESEKAEINSRLVSESENFQKAIQDRDELSSQVSQLQAEIRQLNDSQAGQTVEIKTLKEKADLLTREAEALRLSSSALSTQKQENEKQIVSLQEEIRSLKKTLSDSHQELASWQAQAEKFQKVSKDRDDLFGQVRQLKSENSRLEAAQSDKDKEIDRLKGKLNMPTGREVPICLENKYKGAAGFKFADESNGNIFTFSVPSGGDNFFIAYNSAILEVQLPPGNYLVTCYVNGRPCLDWDKGRKIVVTKEPSTSKNSKWYHCYVCVP